MKEIQKAFIFGSYASGDADQLSDIDLMIIGEVDLEQLSPMIDRMEKEINRPINYIIYSDDDWKDKAERQDSFWKNVNDSPKIYLIGNNDAN